MDIKNHLVTGTNLSEFKSPLKSIKLANPRPAQTALLASPISSSKTNIQGFLAVPLSLSVTDLFAAQHDVACPLLLGTVINYFLNGKKKKKEKKILYFVVTSEFCVKKKRA